MNNKQVLQKLYKGDFFGQYSIYHDEGTKHTLKAESKTVWISLRWEFANALLGGDIKSILNTNSIRHAIENSSVLNNLAEEQINAIVQNSHIKLYSSGDVVIPQGTLLGQWLWIIIKGALQIAPGVEAPSLTCIGDAEITGSVTGKTILNDITAVQEVHLVEMSLEMFEKWIGGKFSSILKQNQIMSHLSRVDFFKGQSRRYIQKFARLIKVVEFQNGETICEQGVTGNKIYIIKRGKVDIVMNGIRWKTFSRLDYIGARSSILNKPRRVGAVAKGTVLLYQLSKEQFLQVLNENSYQVLKRRIQLQDDDDELSDLDPTFLAGKGMTGNVFQVKSRKNGNTYALKVVSRRKVAFYNLETSLLNEKDCLTNVDHPMILKLIKTFKDSERIYFLTEYIAGTELFDVLQQIGICSEEDSKFYYACCLIILDHLAQHNVCYRDLKPENIMITPNGYPKLVDFGTAILVNDRTYTIVGTPHYMAPEMILGKGYDREIDIWALGVMFFQFIFGKLPWGEDEEDPMGVYAEILNGEIIYPNGARERMEHEGPLIEKLLDPIPSLRGTPASLMQHDFLKGYDLDKLLSQSIKPPFMPNDLNRVSLQQNQKTLEEAVAEEELEDDNLHITDFSPEGWDARF